MSVFDGLRILRGNIFLAGINSEEGPTYCGRLIVRSHFGTLEDASRETGVPV